LHKEGEVRGLTAGKGTFEDEDGVREITPAEGKRAEPDLGKNRAAEVPSRLGNLDRFRAAGHPLGKFPEFCEAAHQPAPGAHGGNLYAGGVRLAQLTFNGCHALPGVCSECVYFFPKRIYLYT
jgi:hypothetical protein